MSSSATFNPSPPWHSRSPLLKYTLLLIGVVAGSLLIWPGLLRNLLDSDFMPHGMCLLWQSRLLWLHVASDSAIGIAYVAISLTLAWLVHRARRDIPFSWIFLSFGLFIIACGATHFMEVVTLWKPYYWLSGDLKLITAIASVATAIALPPLVPKTLDLIKAAKNTSAQRTRIEAQNRELEEMTRKLKEADELKTQFFSNISHELRTPLTLVLGRTENLLNSNRLAPDQHREMEVVHRNSRALLKQVNDLLDLARLESGRMEMDYSELDLARFLRRTVANYESLTTERHIKLSCETPTEVIAQVDPDKLERILLNLLSNAFKFTPDGGTIRSALRTDQIHAIIEVSDSGSGIPKDMREAVFERFRQLDGGTRRRVGGIGLGLAIAKDFVKLHHGEIEICDAIEGGSKFTVTLPLVAPAGTMLSEEVLFTEKWQHRALQSIEELKPAHIEQSQPTEVEDALSSAPLILVVEDNPEMSRFIVEGLAGEYRVLSAHAGREGLGLAIKSRPDVILADVMMPEYSGEDLLRELRSRPEFETIPIVLITAKADREARLRALRAGAQDYILKPFSIEELRVRLGNFAIIGRTRRLLQRELNTQTHDVGQLIHEVTVRRRQLHSALDALRTSEQYFRSAIEAMPQIVWTATPDGKVDWYNQRWYDYTGMSFEQTQGWDWQPVLHPDDLQHCVDRWVHALHTGEIYEIEYRFKRHDGVYRWFLGRAVPLCDSSGNITKWFGTSTDIHDQKQAEITKSELAAIVESSDDAIIGKTLDGIITSWNRGAQQIYGYTPEEVIGKPIWILAASERLNDIPGIMERLRRGERIQHHQTVRRTKDGRLIDVSLSISIVRNTVGEIVGACTIARDVTELRRAEQSLRNSEKHAMVGRLSATMAHEINNPLEAVSNILYLLGMSSRLDDEGRQYVSIASQEIVRIAHIVKQTLGFYRESPLPIMVRLPELLDDVLALYARKLGEKKITVKRDYHDVGDIPAFPSEIRQVFSNLIINAIEASRDGGVLRLHIVSTRDWHNPVRCGVRIMIGDNGSGIAPEHRQDLFEPFFTTKGEKGTGLGLWVSNGIVQKHGGSIHVRSSIEPGRAGTCFSIFLPSELPQKISRNILPSEMIPQDEVA